MVTENIISHTVKYISLQLNICLIFNKMFSILCNICKNQHKFNKNIAIVFMLKQLIQDIKKF